ncbi:MAG: CZB domain-containing protein, partial [Gammaproteobacteria bacterium]|nr:CZB domain-containing protein [Gammaproteobacteria bacterium]
LSEMKQHLLNWNIRIMNVLNGLDHTTTAADAANYQSCSLGKWRSSVGRQYEHLAVMKEMDKEHQRFHQIASDTLKAALNHDYALVEQLMEDLSQQSLTTIAIMEQVEQQIGRHSTPEFGTKVAQAKARNQAQLAATSASKQALPAPKVSDEWKEF